MADDNVTRIHPAPSIPNPMAHNPMWSLSDDSLRYSLELAEARLDAVKQTERSIRYERARRESVREAVAYIDKSLDNVADLASDLPWRNEEVIEVLRDVRALLVPTSPDSGPVSGLPDTNSP